MSLTQRKKAEATLETMRKVFTVPEGDQSTLSRLDREISQNLLGFLNHRIVAGDIAPANLEQDFMDTSLPEDPKFVSEQVDFLLKKVVAQSVHTSSPSFIGHMTSALPYFMFPLAKIMMTLNQNVVKIETSKAFTPLERQVIGILHRLIYQENEAFYQQWTQSFTHSLGVFCSGGTIANVTALWVARNRFFAPRGEFRGVQQDGLASGLLEYGYRGACILVSKRGHYSLAKAADALGLGSKNLIPVDITPDHKIDLKALKEVLKAVKAKNFLPLAVVGIAGTTETGSVDSLAELADIAKSEGAHFHVDAAWGGPTLFSERYRHLLSGIEHADSVTIDAHKQLYVPVGAGMVLFKNREALSSVEHHANYIIRRGSRDIGKHTLEGTRPGTAMLVHSALNIIGRKGYELLIDLGIGKAKQFAKMIRSSRYFELISEPELNLLTYRSLPTEIKDYLPYATPEVVRLLNQLLNLVTESIQKDQRALGKTFVSRTRLECERYGSDVLSVFRVVLANPLTTRQVLLDILDEQETHGLKILKDDGFDHLIQMLGRQESSKVELLEQYIAKIHARRLND